MVTSFFEWGNAIALLLSTLILAITAFMSWRKTPINEVETYAVTFILLIVGLNAFGAVIRALL